MMIDEGGTVHNLQRLDVILDVLYISISLFLSFPPPCMPFASIAVKVLEIGRSDDFSTGQR